ncbi:hypothetical protein AB0G87_20095 [Streptomyces asoensis]|uniref:hypothetical protein n=1 Tax=Streptomyces asoensis TaxID=249586 RepID=UPI00340FAD12
MTSLPGLADLRRFADETRAMLQRQDIPETAEAQERYADVVRLLKELHDRVEKPVTFGVVGEFTVGKSLLLGSLLGRPDLLPVEERKSTGNITVLRLRQAPPAPDGGADPHGGADPDGGAATASGVTHAGPVAEVHYLSEAQLGSCVRSILDDLARGMDKEHAVLGAGHVLGGYDPFTDPRGWGPFDQWISCLWPPTGPEAAAPLVDPIQISATHVAAATELCRIRDAHLSQTGLLGTVRRIDSRLVRDALDHGTEERVPKSRPRPRIEPFGADQVETDKEALARSFMLIERVVFDVHVARDHWDLHRLLDEHPLQFLDFPGIGGAGSYGRDTHLSRSELAEVHTILVVLEARRPGRRGVEDFWGMLVQDQRTPEALAKAALVAANMFDKVLVPTLPDGALPKNDLLQRSDALNGIHVHADKFVKGRESAVVLTSSVSAIRRYGLPYADLSQKTRDEIEDALHKLDQGPPARWEETAVRFHEADPRGPWARRLREADGDGGVRALQLLVERQLRANGVAQKLERAEVSRGKLWQALLALQYQVRQDLCGAEPGAAEYDELNARMREYRLLLTALLTQLQDLRGLAGPAADGAPRARPADAGAEEDRGALPSSVAGLAAPPGPASAADEVRREVYEWTEWPQLLRRARSDKKGLVTKSQNPDSLGRPRKPPPGQSAAPPVTHSSADDSRAYIDKFTALVTARVGKDREQLEEWLDGWQRAWSDAFAPLRAWFEEPATPPLLREAFLAHDGDPAAVESRMSVLWTALDPGFVVREQAERRGAGPVADEDLAARFPAQADHTLPWHHQVPDLDPMTESQERHPLLLAQLRQYVADAAASQVTSRLNRLLTARVDDLVDHYEEAARFLPAEDDMSPPRRPPAAPERGHARAEGDDRDDGDHWDDGDGPGHPGGPGGPGGPGPDGSGGPDHPGGLGGQPIDELIRDWRHA